MDFGNYYNMLINEFVNTSDFTILNEEEGFFNWPNSSGVYVIWEKKRISRKRTNLYWNDWKIFKKYKRNFKFQ